MICDRNEPRVFDGRYIGDPRAGSPIEFRAMTRHVCVVFTYLASRFHRAVHPDRRPRSAHWSRLAARDLEGRRVRLFSRRGHEWPDRFPRIGEALASLRARSAAIDGEAVVLCHKTGLSLFDELHSGRHDRDVILYAFDLLELNGKDHRSLPLEERKERLADLLAPVASGIELSEHIEADGETLFRNACTLRVS